MQVIRIQDKVPQIYVKESRDYQVLCRLLDAIVNGNKYDIDSIRKLVNTKKCNSFVLPLLQTKVGFFTDKHFTDETLRLILGAFPLILKNKGSLLAIRQAIYLFLKIRHIRTNVTIAEMDPTNTTGIGIALPDHTIIIGMDETVEDYTALYEILKYVMPFGYGFYFFFYTSIEGISYLIDYTHAHILYSSTPKWGAVRSSGDTWQEEPIELGDETVPGRNLGAIGSVSVYGVAEKDKEIREEVIEISDLDSIE